MLVHGGGPEISEKMKQMGKESVFVGGLRVTDAETLEIAQMVAAVARHKSPSEPSAVTAATTHNLSFVSSVDVA